VALSYVTKILTPIKLKNATGFPASTCMHRNGTKVFPVVSLLPPPNPIAPAKSAFHHHHLHSLCTLLETIQQSPAKHHTCDLSLTTRTVATASYIPLFVKQNSIKLRGWECVQHLITSPGLNRCKMLTA